MKRTVIAFLLLMSVAAAHAQESDGHLYPLDLTGWDVTKQDHGIKVLAPHKENKKRDELGAEITVNAPLVKVVSFFLGKKLQDAIEKKNKFRIIKQLSPFDYVSHNYIDTKITDDYDILMRNQIFVDADTKTLIIQSGGLDNKDPLIADLDPETLKYIQQKEVIHSYVYYWNFSFTEDATGHTLIRTLLSADLKAKGVVEALLPMYKDKLIVDELKKLDKKLATMPMPTGEESATMKAVVDAFGLPMVVPPTSP